eukprot:m.34947 g.34947  ORF g.34947 m.34947 type:complete len:58 (-) comp14353_c0_seq4:1577-1750(-)
MDLLKLKLIAAANEQEGDVQITIEYIPCMRAHVRLPVNNIRHDDSARVCRKDAVAGV